MLWVLQKNLYRERGYDLLVDALERLGSKWIVVKAVPYTLRLLPGNHDSPKAVNPDDVVEPEIDTSGPIVTMGSYTLAKIALARG